MSDWIHKTVSWDGEVKVFINGAEQPEPSTMSRERHFEIIRSIVTEMERLNSNQLRGVLEEMAIRDATATEIVNERG